MAINTINTGFCYSHQPYICELEGIAYLFFCYCDLPIKATYGVSEYSYMPWKIAYAEWLGDGKIRNIRRYETGLKPRDVECSPFFYEHEGKTNCSFIGGVFNEEDTCIYNMYAASGDDLNSLSQAEIVFKESVFAGFQNNKYQLRNWQELECEIEDLATNQTTTFFPDELDSVRRIVGVRFKDDIALITGTKANLHRTFLYDLTNLKSLGEILVNGQPIYKSCLWLDSLVYAKQTGEFEERQLYYSENYELWTPKP
jgi:hypothetical protein